MTLLLETAVEREWKSCRGQEWAIGLGVSDIEGGPCARAPHLHDSDEEPAHGDADDAADEEEGYLLRQ